MSGIVTQPGMWAARNRGGGAGISSISYITALANLANLASYTFAAASLGAADADRHIICIAAIRAGTDRTLTSATIGGVSAVQDITEVTSGPDRVFIFRAKVPSGATGDVVVNLSGSTDRCGIAIYRVISPTLTVHDTASNGTQISASLSIDIAAGGVVIGGSSSRPGQDNVWTGLTRDVSINTEGTNVNRISGANSGIVASAETGRTITCTNTIFPTAAAVVSYTT